MADRDAINAPARTNRFEVELELDGGNVPGWRRIDLPGSETPVAEYREGNEQVNYDHLLTGAKTNYADLVMERGAKTGETMLWDWRQKVQDGQLDEARKEIAVTVFDVTNSAPLLRFEFKRAWPVRYEPPTLDAHAGNIGTETLVIAYEKYERTA